MHHAENLLGRRQLLLLGGGAVAATALRAAQNKPKVGAVITEYRPRSHADVICSRIFNGYHTNNEYHEPRTEIVSMYTDQIAVEDMSRDLSKKHGYTIYPSIRDALTLGGRDLAVDAVLLIGEHGRYPLNERGQKLYPRFRLFHKIVQVFRDSGRVVPVFNDKHLSYSWKLGKQMYDWAQELKIPLMAGSSIPVTPRVPDLEIPYEAKIGRVVQVGYGGIESYGFHTLESMQCMVERRQGGETGVRSVHMLLDDDVWKWRDSEQGRWSIPLLNQALARSSETKPGRPEDNCEKPVLFLVEYNDGLQAAVYLLNGHTRGWMFAGEMEGKPDPVSTNFGLLGEHRDLPHFDGLVWAIEEMFTTGKPVYPVERTLLVTGVLDALFDSMEDGRRVETPHLNIRYRAPKNTFYQRA